MGTTLNHLSLSPSPSSPSPVPIPGRRGGEGLRKSYVEVTFSDGSTAIVGATSVSQAHRLIKNMETDEKYALGFRDLPVQS